MVHVGVLPLLLEYIEQAATHTQVVLSTHSADLLDHVPMECIRVLERDEAGTSVRRASGSGQAGARASHDGGGLAARGGAPERTGAWVRVTS